MPKGDAGKAATDINFERNKSALQGQQRDIETGNTAASRASYFNQSAAQATNDYGNIMGQYGKIGDEYGNFAKTGGYSDQDLSNLRSRGNAPIAAMYQNANRDVDRQRALQGGHGANYMATKAKMARDQSAALSDAGINTEAAIAGMRQQGQLAGMQGQLGAAAGMGNMYSATPGAASIYGNQELAAQGLRNDLYGQQNQQGLGLVGAQLNKSGVPGNYDIGLSRVDKTASTAGKIGMMAGMMCSREFKENITSMDCSDILDKLNDLEISRWNYKGESIRHLGPMAEDFKRIFGVGDGVTISFVDMFGVILLSLKALSMREAI